MTERMEEGVTDFNIRELDIGPWFGSVGVYAHRNVVYAVGELGPRPGVTQLLCTGIPAPPAAPLSVTLYANLFSTDELVDLGARNVPLTYASTIHPDGTWTLDDPVPAYALAPPPDTHWLDNSINNPDVPEPILNYRFPLNLRFFTVASWPVGAPETDTGYSVVSLAPYLGGDFENIDGTIGAHGTRVHLAGRIRAKVDGAGLFSDGFLFTGLPDSLQPKDATGALDDFESWMVLEAGGRHFTVEVDTETGDGTAFINQDNSAPSPTETRGWRPMNPTSNGNPDGAPATYGEYNTPYNGLAAILPFYRWGAANTGFGALWFKDFGNADETGGDHTTWVVDLPAVLALYNVTPDWIQINSDLQILTPEYVSGTPSITADVASVLVTADGADAVYSDLSGNGDLPAPFQAGFLARGGKTAEYLGDPLNEASCLLWRPDEISTITFDSAISGVPLGAGYRWFTGLYIIFLWERRREYIRAGDVIDLDGHGWQSYLAPVVPTHPPGDLAIGDAAAGVRRLPTWRRQTTYPR